MKSLLSENNCLHSLPKFSGVYWPKCWDWDGRGKFYKGLGRLWAPLLIYSKLVSESQVTFTRSILSWLPSWFLFNRLGNSRCNALNRLSNRFAIWFVNHFQEVTWSRIQCGLGGHAMRVNSKWAAEWVLCLLICSIGNLWNYLVRWWVKWLEETWFAVASSPGLPTIQFLIDSST